LNKVIIAIAGKAVNVFALFREICREYGELTLAEMARQSYKNNSWILWEEK